MGAEWEKDLTQEGVRRLFSYDPETGLFTRLVRQGRRGLPGPLKTWPSLRQGYLLAKIQGRSWAAHRLAWLYMQGHPIPPVIDHANGDPGDNRWANLRAATAGQNAANRKRHVNNAVGVKGVCRRKGRYQASITVCGRTIYLGSHKTAEAAGEAYAMAAKAAFREFARTD
jgi:hypothetical protein